MAKIVTLQQLKDHLRYDGCEEDDFLALTLDAAEDVILGYITDKFEGDAYPASVKKAVLILAGYWDNHRNAEQSMVTNFNDLPFAVKALIYRYRKPVVV